MEFKDYRGYIGNSKRLRVLGSDGAQYEVSGFGSIGGRKPVLRPISDIKRDIIHNGERIVPIIEMAKLSYPGCNTYAFNPSYDGFVRCKKGGGAYLYNFIQKDISLAEAELLNELMIDYRGLIVNGLAVDVNTLEHNPYQRWERKLRLSCITGVLL